MCSVKDVVCGVDYVVFSVKYFVSNVKDVMCNFNYIVSSVTYVV